MIDKEILKHNLYKLTGQLTEGNRQNPYA